MSPGLLHYTFFGSSCPVTEFYQLPNAHYVQVLCVPILVALLRGNRVVGVNQTFRHGTRNGITELSQMAPPIFGWAAIIGPHSSFVSVNTSYGEPSDGVTIYFGPPFWGDRYKKRFALCHGTVVPSVRSVCNVGVYRPPVSKRLDRPRCHLVRR